MLTDVRQAGRALARAPWFTITAVPTIALAMVLASTTFAVVDGVLFKPLPYPDADRLFLFSGAQDRRGAERLSFSPRDMAHWRTVPGVRFALFRRLGEIGGFGDTARALTVAAVDREFFGVLGQHPMSGGFRDEDFEASAGAPRGVLLSYSLWLTAFAGDRSVIGRPIPAVLPFSLYVAGVLPPDLLFPTPNGRGLPDLILPIAVSESDAENRRNLYRGLARLEPGIEAEAIRQALAAVTQAHRGDIRFDRVTLEPVDVLGRYERRGFRLAFGAALGLVLLACVNVAGLVTARGRERVRDLSLRIALGARRRDLLRLLLTESALLGLAGGAVGALLAWPGLAVVSSLLPATSVHLKPLAVDARVIVFALSAALLSVVVTTVPAAVAAMRAGRRGRLTAGGTGSTARERTAGRRVLIAAQTMLAVVLVTGGALLFASFLQLASEDHGFTADRTARLSVISSRVSDLLAEIRLTPGVVAAAASDAQIMQGSHYEVGYQFPRTESIGTNAARVTADYFAIAGAQLLEGRLPTHAEIEAGRPLVVISDLLARNAWPGQPVLGRIVEEIPRLKPIGERALGDLTIIGVVTDTRLQSLDERRLSGEIYLPLTEPPGPRRLTILLRTSADPDVVAHAAAHRIRAWDSGTSILAAESLRTTIWGSVRSRTFNPVLYGSLAAAALLLAAVGIAGLVATAVARRRREIGVRMALGADRRGVRAMMMRETMRPVLAGLLAGAVASYWTAARVESSLYETSPHDPMVWMATAMTILLAAASAAYVPARRASHGDPIAVLRAE